MNRKPLSRRRFLTGAAATVAFPAIALGQPHPGQRPQQPPDLFGDFVKELWTGQRRPEPIPEPAAPTRAEDWYIGSVPDGQFEIKKVNFELLNPEFRRQLVDYPRQDSPGTLVVDPRNHFLYSVREGNTAVRYGVGVGREGFNWSGNAHVGRKAEWPDWVPPAEMRLRQPELPERQPGGPTNPLGARALYLYEGNKDTLYRIHGTAEPWSIGTNVSSGCIRMLNEEVADLYLRTPVGTRVVVL
jgi:lipoprotein-anchoring transpeptidase ErfK/SrfK